MGKRLLSFLVVCLCAVSVAFAQKKVTGKVIDSSTGEPIIGASVLVKGTNTGAASDLNGAFTINNVPNDAKTLVVSYIGMQTKEVAIRPNLKVSLDSDAKAIEDVIVVGYGTQLREAKTGAVSTVKAEDIKDVPASSVDKMLSGKMAGVQITSQTGQPGSSSQIRIRGISSINAGNEPLWVVDGIPVMNGDQSYFTNTNNAIAMINPDDIESITVLKDAASASVYGSRAANGVILVTTKSGKAGKSRINARAKFGVSALANDNNFGVMTAEELLSYQRQAVVNAGMDPDNPTGAYYRPYSLLSNQTNWMREFTRLGKLQEYEVTLEGGSDKTTYYSSVSYHKNEGVYYGVDFQRVQGRVNVDHEINKWWKTGTRINLGFMKQNDVPMQALYYANPAFAGMTILPWTSAYNEDGSYNTLISENSNTNPRATAAYDDQWEKQYRVNANMYLQYKPIRQLTLKSTNAAELTFNDGRRYWSNEAHNSASGYPILQTSQTKYRLLTTSNTATFADTYNDVHNLRVLLGQEASQRYMDYTYESSESLNPDMPYHVSGNSTNDVAYDESTYSLLSYFGILDYNYDGRYYLQASIREDGSSKFGKDNRWGTFWSVGLSWNINNEKFMQNVDWIQLLKLRASYGVNGNNNISNYMQYGLYSTSTYNGVTGMIPDTPANDNLTWEKNKSWNVGIDFTFFRKLSGSLDLYTRKTSDMLLERGLSYTSGFSSALQNIGSMNNKGIEFSLNYDAIQTKNWKWEIGFNIAHNKSKILELGGEEMLDYSEDSRLKHIVGESMYTFYLKDYYGVNPVNGEALWRTEDGKLTNDYTKAAYVKAGSPEPKVTGGINTTLSWKNLSLSVVTEFKAGNKVFIGEMRYLCADGNQMSMNQSKEMLNYWKQPGDTGCNPKPVAGQTTSSYSASSTRWLQDGSYFRFKDVTLSYTLPQMWLHKAHLSNLRVYASALNLWTFHKVDFWDPERGVDGMGFGIYPMTKSFVVGLELGFGADTYSKSYEPTQPRIIEREVVKEVPVEKEVVKEVVKEVPAKSSLVQNTYVVTFEVNSSEIKNNAELAGIPAGSTVEVVAYASPEGDADANVALSQRRADAVAKYLKSKGINVVSTSAKGADTNHSNRIAIVTVK